MLLPDPEFPDDADRLAGPDVEAHAVHRPHHAGIVEEITAQPFDLEDRRARVAHGDRGRRFLLLLGGRGLAHSENLLQMVGDDDRLPNGKVSMESVVVILVSFTTGRCRG